MWSEYSTFYGDGKLLDLGLHFGEAEGIVEPNVAIEMKWTNLTKEGYFYKNCEVNIKNDIVKLYKCNKDVEKYFMQFTICSQTHFNKDINENKLIENMSEQINQIIDHRIIRNKKIEYVCKDSFNTIGINTNEKLFFTIILWHMK